MHICNSIPRRLVLAATLLGALGSSGIAHAQNRDMMDDDEEVDVPQAQMMMQQRVFMMDDSNFENWVFGGNRNGPAARERLEKLLTLQIEFIDKSCGLDPAQRKKLELAGHGDVKRFYDRIDVARRKFQKVKNDQNKVGEIYQEIQPIQTVLNMGPFGDGSIFSKTLPRALTPEQVIKFEAVDRERRQFRYGSKVGAAVARLDGSLALSRDQRRKLTEVIMSETKPPRQFGQQDQQVVLLQASKLPEAKLRPIFDEAQWKALSRQFAQVQSQEFMIKNNGYIPADEPGRATSIPLRGK
jgi:hypothetical protein